MSERRSDLKALAGAEDAANALSYDPVAVSTQVWNDLNQVNGLLVNFAQASWRNAQAAAEEIRRSQSVRDVFDIQIRVARQGVDDYVEEGRKLGELLLKISNDALGGLRLPR